VTRLLVHSGADPNIPDEHGRTPLHLAAAAGSHRLARELLKAGANPLAEDTQGVTPAGVAKVRRGGGGGAAGWLLLETSSNSRYPTLGHT
jgi:ankyrin repeat protein